MEDAAEVTIALAALDAEDLCLDIPDTKLTISADPIEANADCLDLNTLNTEVMVAVAAVLIEFCFEVIPLLIVLIIVEPTLANCPAELLNVSVNPEKFVLASDSIAPLNVFIPLVSIPDVLLISVISLLAHDTELVTAEISISVTLSE